MPPVRLVDVLEPTCSRTHQSRLRAGAPQGDCTTVPSGRMGSPIELALSTSPATKSVFRPLRRALLLDYPGDHQWIYRATAPNHVLSVDHTMFFPGGFGWTLRRLAAGLATVTRDGSSTWPMPSRP